VRYATWRKRPRGSVVALEREREREIRKIIEGLSEGARSPSWVPSGDVARLLGLAGIRLAHSIVSSPEPNDAARAATSIGFPVAGESAVTVDARTRIRSP
jgi:hypothetical protein